VRSTQRRLDINGERQQTGTTATMNFDPYLIEHYLSRFLVRYRPVTSSHFASPGWTANVKRNRPQVTTRTHSGVGAHLPGTAWYLMS